MIKRPSPGMLLAATSTCQCGWVGVERTREGAVTLWAEHARGREDHELKSTTEEA